MKTGALRFFLRQAIANLARNRERTLFVLFCIAVGVAAVVSLRSVGLMIGDGLTRNLRADNRGDIVARVPQTDERLSGREFDESLVDKGGNLSRATFSAAGIERLRGWAAAEDHRLLLSLRNVRPAAVYPAAAETVTPETTVTYYVEPGSYPFYGEVEIEEPAGRSLAEALADARSVAVSRRLAQLIEVGVGDQVHVRGAEPFTVTAILADASEARMWEMQAVLLPYLLLPYSALEELDLHADTAFIALGDGGELDAAVESLKEAVPGIRVRTIDDLREEIQELSTNLTRLATLMGLVSLLIGGIGIINTMLVVVGRRTLEIGVLKTVGLQGRQITLMFLIEALVLGVVGSVAGVALGAALVGLLEGVAERVVSHGLDFRIYPEALVMGLVTGVLVTLVFGFLPTLAAARVRPNVVLHPERAGLPAAGAWRSLLVVALLTGVIGLLVGQILGRWGVGMAIAYAAMAGLGIVTVLFRGLVLLVGRLPSFGSPRLKLVQRSLSEHPGRAASTLLALVAGMFSLSSILLLTGALLNLIDDVMERRLGGDVIAVARTPQGSQAVEEAIARLEGVESVRYTPVYRAQVVAIDGNRDVEALEAAAYAAAREEAGEAEEAAGEGEDADAEGREGSAGRNRERFDRARFMLKNFLGELTVARAGDPGVEYEVGRGRTVERDGELEIVLRPGDAVEWLGLEVGDSLALEFEGGGERTATIVGLIEERRDSGFQVQVGESTAVVASADVVPEGTAAGPSPYIIDLADESVGEAIKTLSAIPGVFALPVTLLNRLLTGLFDKLTALPLVVAILALFAAGVIIANTVTLAVLERRRQIGILKAIGLHSGHVLVMLLLENGLLGLLGGLIGTGIGAAAIVLMGVLSESPGSFPFLTLAQLILLAVAIALAATLITAWGASREKPLVVLRYE